MQIAKFKFTAYLNFAIYFFLFRQYDQFPTRFIAPVTG